MDDPYSLGEPASAWYARFEGERTGVVDTARQMAELTIPSVFPPDGYKSGDHLPGNNQSIGARCVNNLASKLMLMAFPPGRPMLRFEPIEHKLGDEIKDDPELWGKIVLALSRKEREHRRMASTTAIASAYTGFLKQLLVAGNALWKHLDLTTPSYRRCDSYVVKRDADGHPLVVVLKEPKIVATLAEDVREMVAEKRKATLRKGEAAKSLWEDSVDIYSVLKFKPGTDRQRGWYYWEEVEDERIEGTDFLADYATPPMYPHQMIPVPGSDWGRSYCEEYRGDLYLVEAQASAINDGAALASLLLTFVKPGSRTSLRQVREAENLSFLPGDAADLTQFRFEKGADMQFVSNNLEAAARRLAFAFLLNAAIQRDAERVTAEEFRRMAMELDSAMGGLYTELAQGAQRHVVLRFVDLHEEDDTRLPKLPKGIIRTAVVTGLDALGSTTEEDALVGFAGTIGQVFGPQKVAELLNPSDFARRLAAEKGLQIEGLVKDEQAVADESAEAMAAEQQQALIEKGTAPAVKAAGDAMMQSQAPNLPAQG